uniref:inositol polyphosphate 5-phosphatase Ka isoform X1 n=1 Tax=Maylandia zebra TaxID=106582 RepID=UPI000D322EA3|nr:inositol polyphosphate 5-phosphatase K isoform X1 [Maylandia zebra]
MDEITRLLGSIERKRTESISTQSTGSKLALLHRLHQLMTCVEDLNPKNELHEKVVKTLDYAFLVCGKRANKPKKDSFRLHMVTWNVATADPPDDVTTLLHLNSPKSPDLYVIGLQEVYSGPLRFVSDAVFDDPWSYLLMSLLAPQKYIKVSSIRMQGLLLLFFSKLEHVPFIRDVQATYTRTGLFGYWGNKGGVSIRLSFYGHTLCFLNCHLAAHMNYASERVDEFEYIMDMQSFDCKRAPAIVDHRLVFWFGDLNFRIQDHGMHFVRTCIDKQNYSLLWSKDQLIMMKQKEQVLQEFEEGPLDFQPTYKFDRSSDTYDTRLYNTWFGFNAKKRKPAWTDRILWRLRPKALPPDEENENKVGLDAKKLKQLEEDMEYPLKIRQDVYTSMMEYSISDHKPVIGIFTLELRKMYETPLVRLRAEGDWSADIDAMVVYSPLQPFPSSTWDWIGLYKVGFSSVSDYITYTWVKDDEVAFNEEVIQVVTLVSVYVSKEEIPVQGGDCVLCYYCNALKCIIGISEPFQVQASKVAIEEGMLPERINGLDKAVSGDDF